MTPTTPERPPASGPRSTQRQAPGAVPPEARMPAAHAVHPDALLDGLTLPLDDTSLAVAARRVAAACPSLPRPGGGHTLARWRFLAELAALDLSLVKIYEAHADARAILDELGTEPAPDAGLLAVWAARAPRDELRVVAHDLAHDLAPATRPEGRYVRLTGSKPWCSGARFMDAALVTCIGADGRDELALVSMRQPGVTISERGWEALGMRATQSVEIDLVNARARLVGASGAYLERPGFWHGGAGIAACWYGAAAALAARLHDAAARRDDPHLRAHLGAADVALSGARALLREASQQIDADPRANAMALALRVRGAVEAAAEVVLRAAAHGLGAGPLCRDRWFAQMAADLPVFLRQSHAERDLATLGAAVADAPAPWRL
ncbi:acyl-CoA dehydrogenase [Burkholderia plantarii]|uniref:acyl-CoA dehydrogenase family protein n=1 Tax=Burkholderia plantarii TaxID=41899 RepID=UPI00272BC4BF|nr:acyl-CoA dehydrogenase family protein [Burkholderia plantarii]WLE59544.1 acyl-CoA dehydrogenase [Burkholderia plantarii]